MEVKYLVLELETNFSQDYGQADSVWGGCVVLTAGEGSLSLPCCFTVACADSCLSLQHEWAKVHVHVWVCRSFGSQSPCPPTQALHSHECALFIVWRAARVSGLAAACHAVDVKQESLLWPRDIKKLRSFNICYPTSVRLRLRAICWLWFSELSRLTILLLHGAKKKITINDMKRKLLFYLLSCEAEN